MGYKNLKTCRTTLLCFKFLVDVSSFSPCRVNLSRKKKHLLQVEEMQHADWLICLVGIQDGSITTNLLRHKLRV